MGVDDGDPGARPPHRRHGGGRIVQVIQDRGGEDDVEFAEAAERFVEIGLHELGVPDAEHRARQFGASNVERSRASTPTARSAPSCANASVKPPSFVPRSTTDRPVRSPPKHSSVSIVRASATGGVRSSAIVESSGASSIR
jgi:hypothetical protein